MKLWLVRHARPLVDEGLCYGATDCPADPQGTRQAADELAAALPAGLAVASSPLRRCRQLAEALQAVRPDLRFRTDARLAELDFGSWEGVRWSDIPQDEYERWTADFPGYRFGGRECVAQLMARVSQALAQARRGGDAAWITHGGVIRAVRLLAGGLALPLRADAWPRAGLGFGQSLCLALDSAAPGPSG